VQIAFNRRDQHLVEKYAEVCNILFHRKVEVVDAVDENITRLKLHVTPVARHLHERFYNGNCEKTFPLELSKVSNQTALGILEGLFDSDGHEEPKRLTLTNTSLSVVMLAHHILNRFGVAHSISRRPPRLGGVNSRGVRIEGRKDVYEVRVQGHIAATKLKTLLTVEGHQIFDKFSDFMVYRVVSAETVNATVRVYDLRVASNHHSFASPGMVVHNCGDWIDRGAAQSTGTTQARACATKEKGIDLTKPNGRLEEAIVFYYRALGNYVLDQIADRFKAIADQFSLSKPIPLVVSGGTSKVGGFMPFFTELFEERRKRFPIEISDIRHAAQPLNAVALGMLVQATTGD